MTQLLLNAQRDVPVEIPGQAEPDERAHARAKLLRVVEAGARPPTTVRIGRRDDDTFLFRTVATGRDGVACRLMGTEWDVIDSATSDQLISGSIGNAVGHANAVNARVVLFVEPRTRGLHALYRRFDGHYGLIAPAA